MGKIECLLRAATVSTSTGAILTTRSSYDPVDATDSLPFDIFLHACDDPGYRVGIDKARGPDLYHRRACHEDFHRILMVHDTTGTDDGQRKGIAQGGDRLECDGLQQRPRPPLIARDRLAMSTASAGNVLRMVRPSAPAS